MHRYKHFVFLTVTLALSGCSEPRDLYLKDVKSGRLYGPLNTSKLNDRHIPEGPYYALYSPKILDSIDRDISMGTATTVILRYANSTNEIPRSEWSSAEAAFLLSHNVDSFSSNEPGSIIGEPGVWAVQLIGIRDDQIVVQRVRNDYQWPPSINPIDLDTHRYLTGTIIDKLEFRQASLETVLQGIRHHVPRINNEPALIIKYELPDQPQYTITLNLRKIRLIDAIEYVAELSDHEYKIYGNTIIITDNVQHKPPEGRGAAPRP